ncbi:hypothetical protein [Rhodanobacter sp. BL-MT-08]
MKSTFALALSLGCLLAANCHASTPEGWFVAGSKPADYVMGSEPGTRRPDSRNAFIRAKTDSDGFGTLMQTISAANYQGKRIRLSGYLRTKDAGKGQMWMRIDGDTAGKILGFDNMEQRALQGDQAWRRCDIVLDVPANAKDIAFGFFLSGKGELWGDSFALDVVDKDVAVTGSAAPQIPDAPVNLDFSQ